MLWYLITVIIYIKDSLQLDNLNNKKEEAQTKFVYTIFRHGARSPGFHKNKEFNIDILGHKWNLGEKELTNLGLRQHYILGLSQRERYNNFLGEYLSEGELLAYSTDKNRTIQSFKAHFQGLYLSNSNIYKNQTIVSYPPYKVSDNTKNIVNANGLSSIGKHNTNIIAFHHIQPGDPYLYLSHSDYCTGISKFKYNNVIAIDNIKTFYMNNHDKLKNIFGVDYELQSILDYNVTLNDKKNNIFKLIDDVKQLYDAVIANYFEENDFKRFFNNKNDLNEFIKEIIKFKTIDMTTAYYDDSNSFKARVVVSNILIDILNQIEYRKLHVNSLKEYNNNYPKMIILSGHDTTLSPFIVVLNYIYNTKIVYIPYASYLNIQVDYVKLKNNLFKWDVKIIYNDNTIVHDSLDSFEHNLKKIIIPNDQISKFCKLNKYKDHSRKNVTKYIIVTIIGTLLILNLIVILSLRLIKYIKANKTTFKKMNISSNRITEFSKL